MKNLVNMSMNLWSSSIEERQQISCAQGSDAYKYSNVLPEDFARFHRKHKD